MIKLKETTDGFSPLEGIATIGFVVLIILIGWLAFNHYDKSDAGIVLNRQQYIDKYVSGLSVSNYTNFGNSLYKAGYLTSGLYNTTQSLINSYSSGNFISNPSYASIICVDEIPKAYDYGKVSVNSDDNTATVRVKVFTFESVASTSYTASWVNNSGKWQLNNVSCSQN